MFESVLPPELIWGLIPRFVGFLHVLAFASLIPQLASMIGSHGLVPASERLARIRRDYPGLRRFFEYPSVLWLSSSDSAIRVIPWLGVACGLCAMLGGPLGYAALALAWLLWLSLESAALIFPWDTMLQEVGFLVLFLPAVPLLPELAASALPLPSVAFMFRFLVLRLMLGFGKLKFIGAKKDDALYLRGFFVWMPSPTPLAWLAHHAPQWMLRNMLYFMFAAEVIAPLLGFFAGPPRLVSYVLLVGLMLGIQATGNWGLFNIGYILLCTCLLDTQSSLFDWGREPWAAMLFTWPTIAINAALLLMFLTGVFFLVVADSWVGRTFMHWPTEDLTWNRPWARLLVRYFRAIAPFRIVNGYGVFPPNSVPPLRVITVFEGSDDGTHWQPYRYKFLPTQPTDRPPFVAPHHPRIDMAVVYAGACVFDASFYASMIGDGTPYAAYTGSSWLDRIAQRLLQGDPVLLRAFKHNPFPDAPPKFVRGSGMAMAPTALAERRATGRYWNVRRVGTVVPARALERWPDAFTLPEPELFHPDWVSFKRRSATLKAVTRTYQAGVDPERAILEASDLSADEVRRFWQELVPALNEARGDFARHQQQADALKARFGIEQLQRFERILERFAWLLRLRTERHHHADATPKIPLKSNFRYHMFLQEAVTDGRQAYLALLADPAQAAARAARSSDATQLWTLAMLRHDLMMAHVRAFRWYTIGRQNYELKIPGLFEYYPLLATVQPPEEEFVPQIVKHPDGEHSVEGLYTPPSASMAMASPDGA
jgi:hypothetical protein